MSATWSRSQASWRGLPRLTTTRSGRAAATSAARAAPPPGASRSAHRTATRAGHHEAGPAAGKLVAPVRTGRVAGTDEDDAGPALRGEVQRRLEQLAAREQRDRAVGQPSTDGAGQGTAVEQGDEVGAVVPSARQPVSAGEVVEVVEVGRQQDEGRALPVQRRAHPVQYLGLREEVDRDGADPSLLVAVRRHAIPASRHALEPRLHRARASLSSHSLSTEEANGVPASLLRWLASADLGAPDGHCLSWWNPERPGYPYPEISGLLLHLLAIEGVAPQRRAELRQALVAGESAGSGSEAGVGPLLGVARAGRPYTFDTAMGLRGLLADHDRPRTRRPVRSRGPGGALITAAERRTPAAGGRQLGHRRRGHALVRVVRCPPGEGVRSPGRRGWGSVGAGPGRRPGLRRRRHADPGPTTAGSGPTPGPT